MNLRRTIIAIGGFLGLPFILIGWLCSIIEMGFLTGYESFAYGEAKMGLLKKQSEVIDKLLKEREERK